MSTSPDRLFHMGGAPVSGNPYLGMWGESTYFVDYDNGTTGGSGKTPASASKHLETAISNADANDVIYVRPRTPATTSWDPNYIIPSSTSNWTIPYTKHGLAIIGTGYGRGQGSQFYTYLRGTGTATATPALDINAPWTLIENLSFHDGASTASCCVHVDGQSATSGYATGNTVSNCMFRFSGLSSLTIDSASWTTVLNCTFHKGAGISIASNEMVPDGIEIGYCNFVTQTAAEVNCDIYIAQTDMINIHDCNFTHAIPTGGENRYIKANAASTGIVANCSFATATLVTGTIMTLNGIIESGSTCALGFLTS